MSEAKDLISKYLLNRGQEVVESSSESLANQPRKLSRFRKKENDIGQSEYAILANLAKYPPLTPEENVSLAIAIEAGVLAMEQLAKEGNPAGLVAALNQIVQDGKKAYEKLYITNLRLVLKISRESGNKIPLEDRFQSGCEGLDRAIKGWDYRLGYAFSTYSTWWIKQAITRSIANDSRIIRHPVHLHDEISQIIRFENDFEEMLGVPPSTNQILDKFEITFEHYFKLKALERDADSIDEIFRITHHLDFQDFDELDVDLCELNSFTEEISLLELLFDPYEKSVEEYIFEILLSDQLNKVIETLSEREAGIIKLRFGMVDGETKTLDEIGKIYGVTRERIRQIESKAMSKLRHPCRSEDLYEYLK